MADTRASKVKDQNNDNIIDAKDKVILGQQLPKWTGSITNTFTYKNWDLAFNVYTVKAPS